MYVILSLIALFTATTAETTTGAVGKCRRNEFFQNCATFCEATCAEPIRPPCYDLCRVGCSCIIGYVREQEGGRCIPLSKCPKKRHKMTTIPPYTTLTADMCGLNEYYSDCGSPCPEQCGDVEKRICGDVCIRGCFCRRGYVRKAGACIPREACMPQTRSTFPHVDTPRRPHMCPANMVWRNCGTLCELRCGDRGPPPCPFGCKTGCQCAEGFVRVTDGGRCIKRELCPRHRSTAAVPEHIEYKLRQLKRTAARMQLDLYQRMKHSRQSAETRRQFAAGLRKVREHVAAEEKKVLAEMRNRASSFNTTQPYKYALSTKAIHGEQGLVAHVLSWLSHSFLA